MKTNNVNVVGENEGRWTRNNGIMIRVIVGLFILLFLLITQPNLNVNANSNSFSEHSVSFQSQDETILNGSLLVPNGFGPFPSVILIHGAGIHTREEYRAEAEMFVKSGIAAFIYDKRSVGYSADGMGEKSRSYSLLAEDVLAAVQALRLREELDSEKIGVWGLSEGGWVGPLAAIRSDEVAFVITVGASGVPPAQQTSWAMENMFRQQGITASSFINSITRTGMRFLVSSKLFAEATYNPVPILEQLNQPLLAIWGSNDRTAPPAESYQTMKAALDRGGNEQYTFEFIQNANHDMLLSTDGYIRAEQFAPGYAESMVLWIENVLGGGVMHERVLGEIPQQSYNSTARVLDSSWIDSLWLQLGLIASILVFFSSYFVIGSIRLFRKSKVNSIPTRHFWMARILASSGLASTIGFVSYYGSIMFTNDPGFIIVDRPIWWIIIQLLALVACVSSIMFAISWWNTRAIATRSERVRLGLLLMGFILFLAWGLYWNIISLNL